MDNPLLVAVLQAFARYRMDGELTALSSSVGVNVTALEGDVSPEVRHRLERLDAELDGLAAPGLGVSSAQIAPIEEVLSLLDEVESRIRESDTKFDS